MIDLLQKISMDSGPCCAAIDLTNWFFSISIRREDLKQFALTWNRPQYSFTVLPRATLFLLPSVFTFIQKDQDQLERLRIPHSCTDGEGPIASETTDTSGIALEFAGNLG